MKFLVFLLAFTSLIFAEIKVPNVFGNHMVLQRDIPLKIWGWATPKESVTVSLNGKNASVITNKKGEWKVTLPAQKASFKATTLEISGSNKIVIKDILIGDVWLCSGQSNMEWPLSKTDTPKAYETATNSHLRMLKISNYLSPNPQKNFRNKWTSCNPNYAKDFSGVAYFFGKNLLKQVDVPIGLIQAAWGGTRIEPWMAPEGFTGTKFLKNMYQNSVQKYFADLPANLKRLENWIKATQEALYQGSYFPNKPPIPQNIYTFNWCPTAIYNARIFPVVGFGIKGVIWYQGEANVNDLQPTAYYDKMAGLIQGWRQVWQQGDFPFYFVNIAPGRFYAPGKLPELWACQTKAMNMPQTGMAVVNDICTLNNIHPPNKKEVGNRLALWALAKDYGHKDLIFSGPKFKEAKVEGDKIILSFDYVGKRLKSSDGKPLNEFQVAGKNGFFKDAQAVIVDDLIVVSSPTIQKPVAVRFGWHNLSTPNLVNSAGLPAIPFTTE